MNLQRYIYIFLSMICLTACVKDVVIDPPVIREPEETGVKFILKAEEFSTKGAQDHHSTQPLPEEKRIFNYAIFIFNANQELEATLTADPYSPETSSTGIDYNQSLTFRDENGEEIVVILTTGVKYMFALVNAPEPLLEERDQFISRTGTTLQDFTNWILNVEAEGGLGLITGTSATPSGRDRGFMMTSRNGAERVILDPSDEGEVTTITMPVVRAMAKVSVASDLSVPYNPEQQPYGEFTDIYYKIVNNPHTMYVVPSVSQDIVQTPAPGGYVDSPGPLAGNYIPVSRKGALTQLYCMENAGSTADPQTSTMAIVKGTFTPHLLYQANGVDLYTGYRKGDDFWRVANVQNGQRVSYESIYYGEDPSKYLEEGQVVVPYPAGETYYGIYLRNDNSTTPYTVRRNSFYNIDITRVNHAGEEGEGSVNPGPGPEVPEDPDPEDPDPGPGPKPGVDGPQIEVAIRIGQWETIDQGGNL